MKLLIKKFRKDISKNIGQFIAISLVIAIGIAFYVGLSYSHDKVNNSIQDYYQKSNLADYWVTFPQIDDDGLKEIGSLDNVLDVQGEVRMMGTIPSSTHDIVLQSYSENIKINTATLTDGNFPSSENEISIDSAYASNNGIKVNDDITINVNNEEYNFKVSGVFQSAEYIYYSNDSTQPVPNHSNFAIGLINEDFFHKKLSIPYNQVIVKTKKDMDKESFIEELKSKNEDYILVTDRGENISYNFVKSKMDSIKTLSIILPIVFVFLSAVITSISMSRQIESQRDQIAIMKAFGISNKQIIISYLQYPLLTSFIGTTLGTIIGIIVFPKMLISTLEILFIFPPLTAIGYIHLSLIGFTIAFLLGSLATIIACRKILKEIPAQAMRPLPPKKAKVSFLERNKFIWGKLSDSSKLIVRNIFMNKKRFLLSSLGVIFCICIMIASIGIKYAFSNIIDTEFNIFRNYDINTTLSTPILNLKDDIELSDIKGVAEKDVYSSSPIDYMNESTKLNIVNSDTKSNSLYNVNGDLIDIKASGVYVSEKFAKQNSIKNGDSVVLTLNTSLVSEKVVEAKVLDIYSSYTSQGFYTTFEFLEDIGINFPITNVLFTALPKSSVNDLKKELGDSERFSHVTIKSSQEEEYVNASGSMDSMIIVMIVAAILLVFTVIYNISSINIFERRRDIATEKVLGLSNNEISHLIFTENIILVLFSSFFGILLSSLTYSVLCGAIVPEEMAFPKNLNLISIPISILITLAFSLLINKLLKGKIKEIDMVESLKSVE